MLFIAFIPFNVNIHNFIQEMLMCLIQGAAPDAAGGFYVIHSVGPWLVWLSGLSNGLWTKGSWVPSQGTCLSCRPGPQSGELKRQPHIDVSLLPSLSLSLKVNKVF